MNTSSDAVGKMPSLKKAIGWALALVFFDAFLLNQGAISALVGAGLVLIGLPLAIRARPPAVRAARLRNLGIYGLAVIAVFAFNAANNQLAHHRAEVLIEAINHYQQKHQAYPQTLNDLVPEFIDEVPLAKYTLSSDRFYYGVVEGKPALFYVSFPPFGRPTYNFSTGKWGYID